MSFIEFKLDNLEEFPEELNTLLERQLETIDNIVDSSKSSYRDVLKPIQDLESELEIFFTPLSHLNSVNNSDETKEAYEKSLPQISKFHSKISQNEKLFHKIESLTSNNLEESRVIKNSIRDFILSGAKLSMEEKRELEEINLELSELSNSFFQHLLDANSFYELIIENSNDIKGIPDSDLALAKRVINGREVYRFTLQIPSYLAYMTYGVNREYREILYRAYSTRAPQNSKIIDKILLLRDREAKLLGFNSYTELSLETKDAPSSKAVIDFLEELLKLAKPQAIRELDELKEFEKYAKNR